MASSTSSNLSLCSRMMAEEDDGITSRSLPCLDDKDVADAVEGLLMLCGFGRNDESEIDSDDEEDMEVDEEDMEVNEEDEDDEEEEGEEEEEVRPCSFDGRTWNWKKSLSVNRACESPPPSPENKHVTKLQEEMDSLLNRRAVFQQELERVRKYQQYLKSFNKKLRKELEESDV